jgi:hypothetical protein
MLAVEAQVSMVVLAVPVPSVEVRVAILQAVQQLRVELTQVAVAVAAQVIVALAAQVHRVWLYFLHLQVLLQLHPVQT